MFIIAEISSNHHGKKETALKLCEAARDAGADAVKLQTFTPEGITLDKELRKAYRKAVTPRSWHEEIFAYCHKLGLTCFSTPANTDDVDFLESLSCPIYKIASFEIIDIPLIEYIARTGKPVIMSTGMATEIEINEALRAAQRCSVTLLKCTSAYPAEAAEANLLTLVDLKQKYKHIRVGISDHAPGIGVSVAAVALGAEVVEKHFTLEKKGPDAGVSLLPEEFKRLSQECRRAEAAIGHVHYGPTSGELQSYRRSLWAAENIAAGEHFTTENIKSLRPFGALPPKHLPTA